MILYTRFAKGEKPQFTKRIEDFERKHFVIRGLSDTTLANFEAMGCTVAYLPIAEIITQEEVDDTL